MVEARQPSLGAMSFNCPHCGALAHQTWFECYANAASKRPSVQDMQAIYIYASTLEHEKRNELFRQSSRIAAGFVNLGNQHQSTSKRYTVDNLYLSRCFSCKDFSVWLYDKVVFPSNADGFVPIEDMPEEIAANFREAASIVDRSPRGAAALLRLCVQQLCKHAGEEGENINNDIGSLVKKGLSPTIQRALDIVRVVGNNAVHPGQLDLADDRATAHTLFSLVNVIVRV